MSHVSNNRVSQLPLEPPQYALHVLLPIQNASASNQEQIQKIFEKMCSELSALGVAFPSGQQPVAIDPFIDLQTQAKKQRDDAIQAFAKALGAPQADADATRAWLQDEKNASRLKVAKLDLSKSKLTTVSSAIYKLTALQELNLSDNQIRSLADVADGLKSVKVLDLSRNQLSALPEGVDHLTGLRRLELNQNLLKNLPEKITQLTRLHWLSVNGNQLTELPAQIRQLTGLVNLKVQGNQLQTLPKEISHLTKLSSLDVAKNKIKFLPHEMSVLPLGSLSLEGNPLLFLQSPFLKLVSIDGMKGDQQIQRLQEEFSYPQAESPLGKLCQALVNVKSDEEIHQLFHQLPSSEKNLIAKMVWIGHGSPPTDDRQWGEHHACDNRGLLFEAIKKSLEATMGGLPEKSKGDVYFQVWALAKNPPGDNWGEQNAWGSVARFADAINKAGICLKL